MWTSALSWNLLVRKSTFCTFPRAEGRIFVCQLLARQFAEMPTFLSDAKPPVLVVFLFLLAHLAPFILYVKFCLNLTCVLFDVMLKFM